MHRKPPLVHAQHYLVHMHTQVDKSHPMYLQKLESKVGSETATTYLKTYNPKYNKIY